MTTTRRQRRRWAAEGGRPRDRRDRRPAPPAPPAPPPGPHIVYLDSKRFENPTLQGLAEQLREEGYTVRAESSTLHIEAHAVEPFTATLAPDPRVLEAHHDNRAKRRARGER